MIVYYIMFSLFLISYLIISPYLGNDKNKFWAITLGVFVFFLMALRDSSVGVDISGYLASYEKGAEVGYKNNEIGFYYFRLILNLLGFSSQQYLAIVSAIIVFSFFSFFSKFSLNTFISIWLFLTIGLFSMTMSGLRQSLAISILLFGIPFVIERKPFKFLLLLFLASSFHLSAFIFCIVYFLPIIKLRKKIAYIILLGSLVASVFSSSILDVIFSTGIFPYFQIYTIGENPINPLVVIENIVITLACLFFLDRKGIISEESSLFLWMSLISTSLSLLSIDLVILGRIGMYFSIANSVLIPNVITRIQNREIQFVGWSACVILSLAHFIISVPGGTLRIDNYKFFF